MSTTDELNYALDRRVLAAQRSASDYPRFDRAAMTLTFGLPAETVEGNLAVAAGIDAGTLERMVAEEEMVEVTLPAHFEVCDTCDGHGTHTNPSIDASGISQEAFDEDPEFEEAYHGGAYDVSCGGCGGARVVPAVSAARLTEPQQALFDAIGAQAAEAERERRNDARVRAYEMGM